MAEDKKRDDFELEWEDDYVSKLDELVILSEERKEFLASFSLGGKKKKKKSNADEQDGEDGEITTNNGTPGKGVVKELANGMFPLPKGKYDKYVNSWGAGRSYGGARHHEGTDIMADIGVPIYSAVDGVVKNKGWNQLGGWRLTISTGDWDCYYAHMSKYAPNVEKGTSIKKGQLIGYVGDSGYGKEGTTGQFDPHLHFGIYGPDGKAVSSYETLKFWEDGSTTTTTTSTNINSKDLPGGLKSANIVNGKVVPPSGSRDDYSSTIAKKRRDANYNSYVTLDSGKFQNMTNNTMMVCPEFKPFTDLIYETFRSKKLLSNGKVPVNVAFRKTNPDSGKVDNGIHGWGGAIDIACDSVADAIAKADVCWMLGFRGVAIGGSLKSGSGFLHVDIGPNDTWAYDPWPEYSGPDSWKKYR